MLIINNPLFLCGTTFLLLNVFRQNSPQNRIWILTVPRFSHNVVHRKIRQQSMQHFVRQRQTIG